MDITVRSRKIEDISILEAFQDDRVSKKSLVITQHGWTGRKEDQLIPAYLLAKSGFYAVALDAYRHGERMTQELGGRLYDLIEIVQRTVMDIDRVIDSYADNDMVDISRAGLTGVSMGGVITYFYLVKEERKIKAAVPIIGTPDFESIFKSYNRNLVMNVLRINGSLVDEDMSKAEELARQMQPINRYKAMNGIPILMLNGGRDQFIPIEGVRRFYNLLKPIFYDPEALKFIEDPVCEHYVTWDMNLQMVKWFEKYLK
jgi:hypothetical protein